MIGLLIVILLFTVVGVWGWPLLFGAFGVSNVTDKNSALQHIKQLMITHDITPADVDIIFQEPVSNNVQLTKRDSGNVAKTLFIYLGAIFVLAGVGAYMGMFWDSMSSVMRIFLTLGIGYILFVVLISSLYENKYPKAILPLTFISTFFMAGGWYVLIDEVFPNGGSWRISTLFVFGVMTLHFGVLFMRYSRTALAFTSLMFCYGFMYVGLDMLGVSESYIAIVLGASLFLVGVSLENGQQRILSESAILISVCWLNSGLFNLVAVFVSASWSSVLIGICLMLTAYGLLKSGRYQRLIGLGYLFGSILFYSGLFDLLQSTPIEIVYLAVTVSMLYISVVLHSRTLLLTTALAMLSFIGYFSAQYFSSSLGWPLTLVFMGIVFLGVGMVTLKLRNKI